MQEFIGEYKNVIISIEIKLKTINEMQSSLKSSPDKWSAKEILGHLIDSSINNMVRFVKGQFQGNLIFQNYQQNEWVRVQNYQTAEWDFLIALWKLNNLQIIRIVEYIPVDVLCKMYSEHNFEDISGHPLPKGTNASLEYFIKDYFLHMKHHLNQIFKMYSLEEV
jgi:hypothetical protein